MEEDMKEKLRIALIMRPYLQRGLIIFAGLIVLGGGLLAWKGPTFVKRVAVISLERNLASLGINHIEIDAVNFGWWRIYLKDIHTKNSSSEPTLNIEEMDIAFSLFFKVKAIDVVGATLEVKDGKSVPLMGIDWQDKTDQWDKRIKQINQLQLPAIALRDCLLVLPGSKEVLKIPVHATTERTVTRNQVLTIDWGDHEANKFNGQFSIDMGRKGITLDLHATNIDIQMPSFQIKAPEITVWASSASENGEGYKIDSFARLDHLRMSSWGALKAPLEINLGGVGTPDNLVLDEFTVMTKEGDGNLLELEGNYKPSTASAQLVLTAQIEQLSKLWDFTPLLAMHANDKVTVDGKVNLSTEISWEKGILTTSALALDVRGVNVAREGFSIGGLATKFIFKSLKPLTTPGLQRVLATKLKIAGVELKNVNFECLFDTEGLFQIKDCMAETLSGSLKAHKFQRLVKSSRPAFQFETNFENIELADLLKLTDLNNLSGHAKLAGNASLRYGLDEGIDVLQAELHSVSDSGVIQYKSSEEKKESSLDESNVKMAFQVLDNLHFTLFSVRLDPSPTNPKEMQGIVKMLGSNPTVLNGYPFEFNIVTTGELKDLVRITLQQMNPVPDLKELNKAVKATKDLKAAKQAQKDVDTQRLKQVQEVKEAQTSRVRKKPKPFKPAIVKTTKAMKVRKKTRRAKVIKASKRFKRKSRKLNDG